MLEVITLVEDIIYQPCELCFKFWVIHNWNVIINKLDGRNIHLTNFWAIDLHLEILKFFIKCHHWIYKKIKTFTTLHKNYDPEIMSQNVCSFSKVDTALAHIFLAHIKLSRGQLYWWGGGGSWNHHRRSQETGFQSFWFRFLDFKYFYFIVKYFTIKK